MANRTHEGLAEDAAAYIGGSSDTFQGFDSSPEEIHRQTARLIEWASRNDVVLSGSYTEGLERQEGATAEHEVFYRSSDNRAVKRTYAGTFGVTNAQKGEQRHATPLFYLRRLQLMNREFNSDLRLEGITLRKSLILFATGDHPCMVISQPWHRPADKFDPPSFGRGNQRVYGVVGIRGSEGFILRLVQAAGQDPGYRRSTRQLHQD